MLKAVLFDLDDTLIDWSAFTRETWEHTEGRRLKALAAHFRSQGATDFVEDAFYSEVHQRTQHVWANAFTNLQAPNVGRTLVESAAAVGVPEHLLDMRRCLEVYDWTAVEGTVIFPDVPASLGRLRAAGVRIGIVTNAYQPMWMRDIEIEALGILHYFPDCRLSAADIGVLKPHPEIFRAALDCVGVRPEEAVFIGDDLEADIAGAQGFGLQAVLRAHPKHEHSISTVAPNAVIRSLEDLFPILEDWFPGWESAEGRALRDA